MSAIGSDDQDLTGATIDASNVLTLSIEDGASTTVDLSAYLDNTDDQTLSSDGSAGNLSIEDGNTLTLNVNDADADPTNEIQDLSLTGNM
ncbi:hypothetical protein [Ostreibacterium oceani]|uniref:Uncharacterized protein n=1 Tax=Ostreibacterium oceani TaxID=2654998 RepID=A0A6N7F2K0_9GAMM|nr:hypothetical protein [Ostreibacterium oceani]MPV87028.1 hypothetical protein [Ostreibacterium oceani]